MMDDARLRTLEERIVQLEDLVEQLNIVVASQADQIDFCAARCVRLRRTGSRSVRTTIHHRITDLTKLAWMSQ